MFMYSYLSEVGALGAPHGRGAHPEDDGARDERVELGVELRPDVGRVAEHGQHLGMGDASFHLTQDLTILFWASDLAYCWEARQVNQDPN